MANQPLTGSISDSANAVEQSESLGPIGKYRWVICALLFFATTINYIDRQILSLLKPILDDQLKWTNEQFGQVNSAFQGAYAVSLLVFGWFIDRVGTKIGYAVSIAAWSVAAACHAFVGSVQGFFFARVGLASGVRRGRHRRFPLAVSLDPVLRRSRKDQVDTIFGARAHSERRRRTGSRRQESGLALHSALPRSVVVHRL